MIMMYNGCVNKCGLGLIYYHHSKRIMTIRRFYSLNRA